MGTVPIHESVAKVATRDLLGVENGFAVSKTGHIALLRHNQIQWLVRPIPDGSQGGVEGGTTATRKMQAGEGRHVLTRSTWGRRRAGSWLSATIFGSTVQEKLFEAAHPAE